MGKQISTNKTEAGAVLIKFDMAGMNEAQALAYHTSARRTLLRLKDWRVRISQRC